MQIPFHIKPISLLLTTSCFMLLSLMGFGQYSWKQVEGTTLSLFPKPLVKERYYQLKTPNSLKGVASLKREKLNQISLPNENGKEELFKLETAPVMSSSLAAKYTWIQTYKGYSLERPEVKVRLSTHPTGFNAWIQLPDQGDLFIQPKKNTQGIHFVYQKTTNDPPSSFFCKTVDDQLALKAARKKGNSAKQTEGIREFRIAIATTGEYTSYWGDNDPSNGTNIEDAFSAVVSTLNRINQIFEKELALRLLLVSDTSLIYETAQTDPFNGDYASELQTAVDEVLGDQAYDLGHLFDYGEPNGDAGCIGCVCESGTKARGFSTHPFTDIYGGEYRNDYFDLDYAGHEIGHQFGAYHTFSYNSEGTGFNAEPGSGSTIMAYAGITGTDDIQLHGDPYFHYYSIQSIRNYIATLDCGTLEVLDLPDLTVDAGPDYFIPKGTAYELSIPPLEAEGVTYCWEQLDSGAITAANFGPYNSIGSMARSLPPSRQSTRSIPRKNAVLSNQLTQSDPEVGSSWETVSLVARELNWGLTVRKNQGEAVQVAQDKMKITVVDTPSPFVLTSQESPGIVWKGGSYQTITWQVAETNSPPFNYETIEIYLSTDGGLHFDTLLANGVSNTGEARVFVPNTIDTDQARIKIKPEGAIFFAINSSNFSIRSRDIVLNFKPNVKVNCESNQMQFDFDIQRKPSFNSPFSVEISNLPETVNALFSKTNFIENDSIGKVTLGGLNNLSPDDYKLNLEVQYATSIEPFSFVLKQRNPDFETPTLEEPADGAESLSLRPTLKWDLDPNVDQTRIQLATDEAFQNKILDTLSTQSQLQIEDLSAQTVYFWRIQKQNSCGESVFSEVFSFSTTIVSCIEQSATGLPLSIEDASSFSKGVTTASVQINYDLPIQDLDIEIDLDHTYLEDLTLYLESPAGVRYLLASELGKSKNDYQETVFDQEAAASILEGTPPFSGRFRPAQSLTPLYGTSSRGIWKLIIEDNYLDDVGELEVFKLNFCLEGKTLPNSDGDSYIDLEDNCPELTNEDQTDSDGNGIGDVCDLFSSMNISIIKSDATCPDKQNGRIQIEALADFNYQAELLGENGYRKLISFTNRGNGISDLAVGKYSLCVTAPDYPTFEYCFDTEISAPDPLNVISAYNPINSILNLSMQGAVHYFVSLNENTFEVGPSGDFEIPLTKKINRISVATSNSCQGVYEAWFNTEQTATVFPNPIYEEAQLILPQKAEVSLFLLSGSGRLIWQKNEIEASLTPYPLPVRSLNPGVYILKVVYPEAVQTVKLLKR